MSPQPSSVKPYIIGVTGGIGSGKSVVCRICALRGIPVYDCDLQARIIMDADPEIHRCLGEIAGDDVVKDGCIDRKLLAARIFSSCEIRERVNSLVHARVREDFRNRAASSDSSVVLIESAILATSSLHEDVDAIWLVDAPEYLRIRRVMRRNGMTESSVLQRIEAQNQEFKLLPARKITKILNDNIMPLLPRIDTLLKNIYTHAQDNTINHR